MEKVRTNGAIYPLFDNSIETFPLSVFGNWLVCFGWHDMVGHGKRLGSVDKEFRPMCIMDVFCIKGDFDVVIDIRNNKSRMKGW